MRRPATVLAYHSVGYCQRQDDPHRLFVRPDMFTAQMAFLARHRRVVSLSEAIAAGTPPGKATVAITFDDGYRSVLEHAVPELERHGFPATMFVPTRYIGDRNRWDQPGPYPLDIMTAEELREAESRGLAIESHGHDHRNLAHADQPTAREDIEQSIAILGELLGRQTRFLAFPYGSGSPAAERAAAAAGLEAAFSTNRPGRGPFSQARVTVTPYDGLRAIRLKTAGHYVSLRYSSAGELLTRPLRVVARRARR